VRNSPIELISWIGDRNAAGFSEPGKYRASRNLVRGWLSGKDRWYICATGVGAGGVVPAEGDEL